MSPERDSERLLHQWLDEGPTRAADRLLETVEERIDRQRQRPAWRLGWRNLFMNRTIGSFAAGMAVVAVALVGYNVLASPGQDGGGSGAPAASQTAIPNEPSLAPSAPPSSQAPASSAALAWKFDGTLPEGWDQDGYSFGNDQAMVEVLDNRSVMATDCVFGPAEGIGTSAAEVVNALTAREGLEVVGPEPTTLGGLEGQHITLRLASDWTGTCPWWADGKEPVVPIYGSFNEKNYWFYNAIAASEVFDLYILQALEGRDVVVTVTAPTEEQFSANTDDATTILGGITFDTGS